jgi:hypothetical protein
MPNLKAFATSACLTVSIAVAPPAARAQWAVIDVGAIAQLIQEVQTMAQQLATARAQLQSAQQTLQAMSGDRGMEKLLAGTQRNYLPTDWTQITSVSQGQATSGYTGLSAEVQRAISCPRCRRPINDKFSRLVSGAPSSRQSLMRLWRMRAAGSPRFKA